ncbi:MAG: UDP-N-acetylmuramoyl-L-alanine--D-glutamate ligase [Calditrichaeota bacterium]|nr:MAG: UDP-N-acetylmuramoyl-L-alanine--D-glutamate ligase [Calditrichota bacterium]
MDVRGKHITVLGAARSGVAAALLLHAHGARVFVSDMAPEAHKADAARQLKEAGIEYEFGLHSGRVFQSQAVVLSPGIPYATTVVQALVKNDIPVVSEIEAAWWFNKSPLIGVTGSNGKTTTTTLIGAMLRQKEPESIVAGNIGTPFSALVEQTAPGRWAVVELSSFQLETIRTFKPRVAVVLNFSPNHLNRYPSYEAYQDAKWRITMRCDADDLLVYNADDPLLAERAVRHSARTAAFSLHEQADASLVEGELFLRGRALLPVAEMGLKGKHNYMNALAAALAASEAGVSDAQIAATLRQFTGLEHRLEQVRTVDDVLYVNDSKATTVESLYWALQSFDAPVILIAGGQDKGSDFTRLNDLIRKHVRRVILIGTAADKMEAAWQGVTELERAGNMEEAVQKARAGAQRGDVVLLSPACASFDMFDDYEARGRIFKNIVKGL